ncbi:MAG: hypothetical protein WBD36_11170 [Bacteroidota bacterium]
MQFKILSVAAAVAMLSGCSKSTNPLTATDTPVNLSVSFSKAGTGTALLKGFAVDSLRIDSAIVVLQRIKFESHVDTVSVDSTGTKPDDESEMNVTFRGPFVVHVRDTVAIDFASQTRPAGTYDGIKFKIHKLQTGEKHEDSDERNHRTSSSNDSSVLGSSIVVWGSILKNGVWTPFTLSLGVEVEFKIKGNFVVSSATNSVDIALNFNMGLWFKSPNTGSLLDPTDLSSTNRELFMRAVKSSFGQGRGGRDKNHDGHPDD